MLNIPGIKNIFFGEKLLSRLKEENLEYNRKIILLVSFALCSITVFLVFIIRLSMSGDYMHVWLNSVNLMLISICFIYMRRSGKLDYVMYAFLFILGAQFLIDFTTEYYRALWSFTMPFICYFMFGTNKGVVYSFVFLLMECFIMFFIKPGLFEIDFKIRFITVYFCIMFFSYMFERLRGEAYGKFEHSHMMLKIQRDASAVLSEEMLLEKALEKILGILMQLKEFECGRFYIVEKKTGDLNLSVCRGLPSDFAGKVKHFKKDSPYAALAMKGVPVYQKYAILAADLNIEKNDTLRFTAFIPIKSGDKVIAVLNMGSYKVYEINPESRNAMESIAANIGNAISRLTAIKELKELSERENAILETVPDIIMETDMDKKYTWANKAGYEFFGDDVLGKPADSYFVGVQDTYKIIEPIFNGSPELVYLESLQKRKDGMNRLLAWWNKTRKDGNGNVAGALATARDITDIRKLEDQLIQSQKMDAVGQLAGGIAHDYNNQLSIISGFAELLLEKVKDDVLLRSYAESIVSASKHSSNLTSQLLAFSRKGKVLSVATNIHDIILEVINILKHTIDKKIIIKKSLDANLPVIMCDPSQVQNAILNIVLNARDAMPEGGELVFKTERVSLADSCRKEEYELDKAEYIRLDITDSGIGMDTETQKRIFEPFFTTKQRGKGVGMGLPAVYGIMKNHHGAVRVYSVPGHGSTFKLYFPAGKKESFSGTGKEENSLKARGGKKLNILFLDDEKSICKLAEIMFASFGHKAAIFSDPQEAVYYYMKSWKSVDIVIMDMIMPGMNGREVFAEMKKINPKIRAVLSSGYSLNDEAQKIIDDGVLGFIQKPFQFEGMRAVINETMVKNNEYLNCGKA